MSENHIKDAPAFDFYPERWLASTADLSDRETRQYLTLLCQSWLRDGLPKSERDLKQICGKKVSQKVLKKFSDFGDGKLRNPFQEEVRKNQRTRIKSSREKIEKMNKARLQGREKGTLQEPLQEGSSRPPSPLTTHPIEVERDTARGAPCTIEQAKQSAANAMIPAELAEEWWHSRASMFWEKSDHSQRIIQITESNWQSDLVQWCRTLQASRTKTFPKPGKTPVLTQSRDYSSGFFNGDGSESPQNGSGSLETVSKGETAGNELRRIRIETVRK